MTISGQDGLVVVYSQGKINYLNTDFHSFCQYLTVILKHILISLICVFDIWQNVACGMANSANLNQIAP